MEENTINWNVQEKINKGYVLNIIDHTMRDNIMYKYGISNHFTSSTFDMIEFRRKKIDPVLNNGQVSEELSWSFPNMWNPHTGDIIDKEDPFGPITFNVVSIANYIWLNRLKKLWVPEGYHPHTGEYLSAHYEEGIGMGEKFNIISRGEHPEWYIFRLPVNDIYVLEHMKMVPSMGPKLTKEDIIKINTILHTNAGKNAYITEYNTLPPNLIEIWEHYHIAISKNPTEDPEYSLFYFNLSERVQDMGMTMESDLAQELLKDMKGSTNKRHVQHLLNIRVVDANDM